VQAVFHAFANYFDYWKTSAENKTKDWIEDETDEDKCDDEISNPACSGVVMPEEVPGLFGIMFECFTHVLVRREMTFKKVFICWDDSLVYLWSD